MGSIMQMILGLIEDVMPWICAVITVAVIVTVIGFAI